MTDQEIEKIACPQCSAVLDVGDKFCRHCGARTARPAAEVSVEVEPIPEPVGQASRLSDSRDGRPTEGRSWDGLLVHPAAVAAPEPAADRPKAREDLAENRGIVLLLLFAVLGPLALPVLWRSSKFSPAWKITLTILVLILTVVVVWALWYAVNMFIQSLEEYGVIETF